MVPKWPLAPPWLACAVLFAVTGAHADALPVLDEPAADKQTSKVQLQVLDDGMARVHLKWSEPNEAKPTVDLSLSTFKPPEGTRVVVGFDQGQPTSEGPVPFLRNAAIPPSGTELRIAGQELAFDLEYAGTLSAMIVAGNGKRSALLWDVTLVRPSSVPLVRCPVAPQIVQPDGTTAIDFAVTGAFKEKSVDLRISSFTSSDRELGQVGFEDATSRELRYELSNLQLVGASLRAPIRASGLSEGNSYGGRVWFLTGGRQLAECALELVMPKLPKGELVSDSQVLSRSITLPMFGGGDPVSRLGVRLYEKTRARQIDGISVMLDGVTESPEGTFDLPRHLSFSLNGGKLKDLAQLQLPLSARTRAARTLRAGEQLEVEIGLHNLQSGKYAFALRFAGVNTAAATPKVDVVVNVRHHWAWAVLAVILALVISFALSTGISNWRDRITVRRRVQTMRAALFGRYGNLPSVVFLSAVLAQTERLMQDVWFLAPPRSVYDHLARAERVASVLQRFVPIWEKIDAAPASDSIKLYYRDLVNDVMHRIGAQPLDQKTADGIIDALGAIDMQLNDPGTSYWAPLKTKASVLASQARQIQVTLGGAVIEALLCVLEQPAANPSEADKRTFEYAYWFVRLLYSRRAVPEDVAQLTQKYKLGENPLDTFHLGDRLAWRRLKAAVDRGAVKLVPTHSAQPMESLRPTKFHVDFGNREIADSYLARSVLSFEWEFRLTPTLKRGFLAAKDADVGEPIETRFVNGARATYYASRAGKLDVNVVIHLPAADPERIERLPVLGFHADVCENTELSLLKNLSGEALLMAIVAAVALVTSLPALYLAKPTFGSFADYTAILVWAIGIDQGKNLIQLLKSYQDASAPSAST